jgi:obg-like ATPase 1
MAPKKDKSVNPSDSYNLELVFGRVKNSLKMGVVGLPNVGKSSFFNLITKQTAEAQNFPFCTIQPNQGRVQVPDERYENLCKIWQPPSEHPAYLNVTDIAGLVRGASKITYDVFLLVL